MTPPPSNDRLQTIGEGGRRTWLYPEWVDGRWMRVRTVAHAVLVVALLVAPWIEVGGHPAIRVDIPGRRIHFWGLTLFATDGSYLLFLFGLVLLSVFLFTALFGRAWCGWACPQTVFLETLVRPLERLLEGSGTQRRRLDRGPWTLGKVARKGAKLAGFLVLAGAIGTTFTAYFLGAEGTLEAQRDPLSHPAGTLTFLILTGLLFFDFAWFREQTCLVVCPYGRFQSVLLDGESVTVAYDARRGEPRGKKGALGAGDCVDCRRCLAVCPTGADIRVGNTLECIQCMACIDACDQVMDRLTRPRGLIRFASEQALAGKPSRMVRPRVVAYAAGLALVVMAFGLSVARRDPVELHVSRQVGAPWVQLPDGRIQNAMRLRVANKGDVLRAFRVEVVGPEGYELIVPGQPFAVPPNRVEHLPIFLLRPPESRAAHERVMLRVRDEQGFAEEIAAEFIYTGGRS